MKKNMVYNSVPCNTTKYHGIPWYAMIFHEEEIYKLDEREREGGGEGGERRKRRR